MSLRDKLLAAGRVAALEERARCLWCAEQVIAELEAKLRGKLLGTAELHASDLKLKIARAVVSELRRAIVSGVRPASSPVGPASSEVAVPASEAGETGQAGATGFSPERVIGVDLADGKATTVVAERLPGGVLRIVDVRQEDLLQQLIEEKGQIEADKNKLTLKLLEP